MSRLLPILLLSLGVRPAFAGHDQEVALSGVLQHAHDARDAAWLRRMLGPGVEFADQFDQRLSELGLTRLVTCSEGPPETFQCQLTCQRGGYPVQVRMSPPDPRPGRIEQLRIGAPIYDPDPLFPKRRAWPALVTLAILLATYALLRRRL